MGFGGGDLQLTHHIQVFEGWDPCSTIGAIESGGGRSGAVGFGGLGSWVVGLDTPSQWFGSNIIWFKDL